MNRNDMSHFCRNCGQTDSHTSGCDWTGFSVCEWGSHPDAGNDDCWNGENFATLEDALAEFAKDPQDTSCAFVELDGPGVYRVRPNPNFRPERDGDDSWRREMAMEAGMLHGVGAYNDVMGWG